MRGLYREINFVTQLSFNLIRFDILKSSIQWWIADYEGSGTKPIAHVQKGCELTWASHNLK